MQHPRIDQKADALGRGPLRAAGYIRVSTEEQAREGVSLAVQEERLRAFVIAKGWELAELFRDEGESAKNLNRPGIQQLFARLRSHQFDVVIIYKLDRLTRSVKDLGHLLETFQKAKVAVSSLEESIDTTTATGKLLVNILGSVAQWEREANAERTRSAIHHLRARLQAYSPTPYGFRRTGDRLIALPAEQRVVAVMRQLRGAGASLRAIGRELAHRGIRSRTGRPWHPDVIARILRNPIHASREAAG